jgi:WD40 repeat protein
MTEVTYFHPTSLTIDIVTTSSRDGSVYIWDLRCTGVQTQQGGPPRYKPTASILGGHPNTRKRKTTDTAVGAAVTGLTWSNDTIVTACDANS